MTHVRRALLRLAAVLAVVSATACVTVTPPRFLQYPYERDWTPTLSRARALAAEGRVAQADSLLAQYASAYPTAPKAVEANYWRALLNLRGPAAVQSTTVAIPLLQTYLAAGPSTEHWMEADALLRAAARVDTLTRVAATYISRGEVSSEAAAAANAKVADAKADVKAVVADSKAQDDEIKRLKDELAKSKEELERIKKRLAEPPKKPPHR